MKLLGLGAFESGSVEPDPNLLSVLSPMINGINCIFPLKPENIKTKQNQTNNNAKELTYAS